VHPIDDFPFKNATSGKRHSRCRACYRVVSQQHYSKNKRAYLERSNPLQREANRIFVTQFLRQHQCVKCGESDPVVLEFNHLDPATKTANICDMIHFRVFPARIRLEMAKCEVLCANCHQRHTTRQSLAHYKLGFGENGQIRFASARMAPDRRNIRIVLQRLIKAACVDCGLADALVLQFDHVESKTKDIASLVRSACSSQRLINELNKCEIRCVNCHRRRTAIQGGWFRARQDPAYPANQHQSQAITPSANGAVQRVAMARSPFPAPRYHLAEMGPEEVVTRFNEAINRGDLEGLGALMADDHTFTDSVGARVVGKSNCLEAWRGFFGQFPDYRNHFTELIPQKDDRVLVIGHSTCSVAVLEGPALWTAEVAGGKVTRWQVHHDTPAVRAALGIPLPSGASPL
jgi:ketosteroid isomerase-like protein